MRSTRKQPFCWQEKKINRTIRKKYNKENFKKVKMLLLYATITEIDSDFNGQDIKYYTKTIATYSGLSKDFIPQGLKDLEKMNIIKITEDRINGKFKGKTLEFTPENINSLPRITVPDKPLNGESLNGCDEPSEDSILKEDNILKEDMATPSYKNKKNFFFNLPPNQRRLYIEDKLSRCLEKQENEQLEEFCSYWMESNSDGGKQKWQFEKTFDVIRRFRTWLANSKNWEFKKNFKKGQSSYSPNKTNKPTSAKYKKFITIVKV